MNWALNGVNLVDTELTTSILGVLSYVQDSDKTKHLISESLIEKDANELMCFHTDQITPPTNFKVNVPNLAGKSISDSVIMKDFETFEDYYQNLVKANYDQQGEQIDAIKTAADEFISTIAIRILIMMRLVVKSPANVASFFINRYQECLTRWTTNVIFEGPFCPTATFFELYEQRIKKASGPWHDLVIYLIKIRVSIPITAEVSLGGFMENMLTMTYDSYGFPVIKHFREAGKIVSPNSMFINLNFVPFQGSLFKVIRYGLHSGKQGYKTMRFAKLIDQNAMMSLSFTENRELCILCGWIQEKLSLDTDLWSNNVNFKSANPELIFAQYTFAKALIEGNTSVNIDTASTAASKAFITGAKVNSDTPEYQAMKTKIQERSAAIHGSKVVGSRNLNLGIARDEADKAKQTSAEEAAVQRTEQVTTTPAITPEDMEKQKAMYEKIKQRKSTATTQATKGGALF